MQGSLARKVSVRPSLRRVDCDKTDVKSPDFYTVRTIFSLVFWEKEWLVSTTRFPMSIRWSSYVAPKTPKSGSKMQSVRNLNNKLR